MQPYQLYWTFYFADPRPLLEIRPVVEQALTCTLQVYETEEYRDEERYRGFSFGFSVFLEYAGIWGDGFIYRLAGTTHTAASFPDASKVLLDHHVTMLLKRYQITLFYTIEEYRAAASTMMPNHPENNEGNT